MNKKNLLKICLCAAPALVPHAIFASDHDDGVSDAKTQATNLTDVYVFRKDSQTGAVDATDSDLIFVMNSNPRSLPKQQYYFDTSAHYDFHVSRVATTTASSVDTTNNNRPTGSDDIRLRLTFATPDERGGPSDQQVITLTTVVDGTVNTYTTTAASAAIKTTARGDNPINNAVTVNNVSTSGTSAFVVFAGLRQDPFFFDVQGFFKFRSTGNPSDLTSPYGDFTKGYNVNTIALEVPQRFLQSSLATPEHVFDTWATISVPTK